jgi:hypothetical protein
MERYRRWLVPERRKLYESFAGKVIDYDAPHSVRADSGLTQQCGMAFKPPGKRISASLEIAAKIEA